MSEVPSVPDSVLYTIILRWNSVALIRLRVFPFSNVYRFPVMMVNVSNLEHYRTLLLLVVRGIRESRLPWEVFVNCLEAGLCVWFADVRKGKIRCREERGWTHSRTPEGNERASCLEKRESHEPTLIEVNFRTCWKQLAAVMKQDVVDRRDAQCGIWMRIRRKNQKSLATFVTFARSQNRFARLQAMSSRSDEAKLGRKEKDTYKEKWNTRPSDRWTWWTVSSWSGRPRCGARWCMQRWRKERGRRSWRSPALGGPCFSFGSLEDLRTKSMRVTAARWDAPRTGNSKII